MIIGRAEGADSFGFLKWEAIGISHEKTSFSIICLQMHLGELLKYVLKQEMMSEGLLGPRALPRVRGSRALGTPRLEVDAAAYRRTIDSFYRVPVRSIGASMYCGKKTPCFRVVWRTFWSLSPSSLNRF